MNISAPAVLTLDELLTVALAARAELDVLQRQRAALDSGVPTEPTARAEWFEAKAELPKLDARLYRARGRSEHADKAVSDWRTRQARAVHDELLPEYRATLRKLKAALDTAARLSADVQLVEEFANTETDGHGFPPGRSWARHLTGAGCDLERWTQELQREALLP